MPLRIVKCKIVGIKREGKTVELAIGSKFNFTADEVAEIESANPDALGKPEGAEPTAPLKLSKAEAAALAKADAEAAALAKADAEAAALAKAGTGDTL